jgi:hypothetical protein
MEPGEEVNPMLLGTFANNDMFETMVLVQDDDEEAVSGSFTSGQMTTRTAEDMLAAMKTSSISEAEPQAQPQPVAPKMAPAPEPEVEIEEDEGGLEPNWTAVLNAGWVAADDSFDDGPSLVGRRLFVMDEGFGTVVRHKARKRGGGMTTIDFGKVYGQKTVQLRLAGNKAGGTAWLARTGTVLVP